jgi:hypothetical protein
MTASDQPLRNVGNVHADDAPWTMGQAVRDLRVDVDELRDWRNEMKGAFALIKILLGTSIVGLVISAIGLYLAVTKH